MSDDTDYISSLESTIPFIGVKLDWIGRGE